MNTQSSKTSIILLSTLALLLATFLVLDIYRVRAENRETSRLLSAADQADNQKITAQSIRLLRESGASDIKAFEGLGLSGSRLVAMIENIEGAGGALGLETTIASVDRPAGTGSSTPQTIALVVETEGTWSGTARFLKALESLPTRLSIKEVNISQQESLWKGVFTLNLYSFE